MLSTIHIACPNCGSSAAERHILPESQIERTQCRDCDYLLVTCLRTNRVLEAYAPTIDFRKFKQTLVLRKSVSARLE